MKFGPLQIRHCLRNCLLVIQLAQPEVNNVKSELKLEIKCSINLSDKHVATNTDAFERRKAGVIYSIITQNLKTCHFSLSATFSNYSSLLCQPFYLPGQNDTNIDCCYCSTDFKNRSGPF